MSVAQDNKSDDLELTLSVMDDAEQRWEKKEREWWDQADRVGQWLPAQRAFVVRCCRQAFISGYLTGVDEERKRQEK